MDSSRDIHAIVIHGVGEQQRGYSDYAMKRLSAALSAKKRTLYAQEVLWAPILDRYENAMLDEVKKRGSSNRPAQRLVVGTLADALAYPNVKDEIMEVVDTAFLRLRSDSCVVFAHSLGVLVATDWLRTRDKVRVDHLVTFGCNLQLFQLGSKNAWECPPQVGKPGVWTNFFDEQDMLGWPLSGWQPQVRDVDVEVGGLITGNSGLAHVHYFDDHDFWAEEIPKVL